MENLLSEAFQKLSLLENDFDFSTVDKDKVDELSEFISDDIEVIPEEPIIDVNAVDEWDLADNYIGKVILECECCHTRIYKDENEIVVDDEAGLANVDEACPVCNNTLGYSVIGKIEAFNSDREIKPEDDEEVPEEEAPEDDEVEDDIDLEAEEEDEDAEEEDEEEKDESLKNSKLASDDSKKLSEAKELKEAAMPLKDRIARKHLATDESCDEKLNPEEANRMAEITKGGVVKAADRNEYKELRDKEKVDEELLDHGNDNLEANPELATKDTQSLEDDQAELVHAADEKIEAINEDCNEDVCPECGKNPCCCEACEEELDESSYKDFADNRRIRDKIANGEKLSSYERGLANRFDNYDSRTGGRRWKDESFEEDFPDDLPDPWGQHDVEEAIHPDLKDKKPVKGDKPFTYSADPEAVKKVFEIIDGMSEEDWNLLNDNAFGAYLDGDVDAKAVVRKLLRKYKLPSWALKAFAENWDEVDESCNESLQESVELHTDGEPVDLVKNEDGSLSIEVGGEEAEAPLEEPIEAEAPAGGEEIVPLDDAEMANIEANEPEGEEGDLFGDEFAEPVDSNVEDDLGLEAGTEEKPEEEEENEEPFESLEASGKPAINESAKESNSIQDKIAKETLKQAKIETKMMQLDLAAKQAEAEAAAPVEEPIEDEVIEDPEIEAEAQEAEEIETDESLVQAEGGDLLETISDLDEAKFNNICEAYLRRVYENVNSFNTSNVLTGENKLVVEGVITFNSGKTKNTTFNFANPSVTKRGKIVMEGFNKTFTESDNAFTIKFRINDNNLIAESMVYNYTSKYINESNAQEVVRIYGRVKA